MSDEKVVAINVGVKDSRASQLPEVPPGSEPPAQLDPVAQCADGSPLIATTESWKVSAEGLEAIRAAAAVCSEACIQLANERIRGIETTAAILQQLGQARKAYADEVQGQCRALGLHPKRKNYQFDLESGTFTEVPNPASIVKL